MDTYIMNALTEPKVRNRKLNENAPISEIHVGREGITSSPYINTKIIAARK